MRHGQAPAMGFPPEAWFEDGIGEGSPARAEGRNLAARVEHLFSSFRHPKTGEPFANADVARLSAGSLTEEDVEGIRSGKVSDPTVGQVAALAAAKAALIEVRRRVRMDEGR